MHASQLFFKFTHTHTHLHNLLARGPGGSIFAHATPVGNYEPKEHVISSLYQHTMNLSTCKHKRHTRINTRKMISTCSTISIQDQIDCLMQTENNTQCASKHQRMLEEAPSVASAAEDLMTEKEKVVGHQQLMSV